MTEVPYVGVGSSLIAGKIEKKFLDLPSGSGLLFVSVHARPSVTGVSPVFDVVLGLAKGYPKSLGDTIAAQLLADERQHSVINIQTVSGVQCGGHHAGAGRDPS